MRIFGGYFNTTMYSNECMGGNIIRYPFREKLEGLLSNSDLLDIKPHNGKYTWSNRMAEGVFITARLDHFLVHSSCLIQDLDPQLSIVASKESDHRSILLVLDKEDDLGRSTSITIQDGC